MGRISGIRRSFRLPWRSAERIRNDVDEELRFHLEMRVEELVALGLTPTAAREEALRQFGDLEGTRRYCRDLDQRREREVRRTELLEEARQDVRYALRKLGKSWGFTLVALVTLALGIGANTAVFSVVNAVLLRSLPFDEPDRLVRLESTKQGTPSAVSVSDFLDWRAQSRSFEGMAAVTDNTLNLSGGSGEPMRLNGARVSASLFPLLRAHPIVGRTFAPEEDRAGAPRVVVLSEALWRSRFGGDPAVVGRAVTLDGEPYTVIGVLPGAEAYPAHADAWVPAAFAVWEIDPKNRGARYISVVARLQPGVTLERAGSEMRSIARRLEA